MKLTDYCSRHPETKDITIANIKNFERAGVSLEQWQKATANDKSLLNGTGKWKRYKKHMTMKDGICYVVKRSGHKMQYQLY